MQPGTSQAAAPPRPTTAADVLGAPKPATGSPSPGGGAQLNPTPTNGAPKPTETTPEDKASAKLAPLIQRERAAVDRERALKAREAQYDAKMQQIADREKRIEEFETLKKSNPRKALELLGMSYAELTEAELNDGRLPAEVAIRQVEEKFEKRFSAQEQADKQRMEGEQRAEKAKHERAIETFKGQIGEHIKTTAERYELMAFENPDDQGQGLVFDTIDEHYNRTLAAAQAEATEKGEDPNACVGEIMTIAEAADKIELFLEQKYQKATKDLKKVRGFLGQRPVPPPVEKLQTSRPTLPTLNNSLPPAPAQTQKRTGIRTDDERVRDAIAWLQGNRAST